MKCYHDLSLFHKSGVVSKSMSKGCCLTVYGSSCIASTPSFFRWSLAFFSFLVSFLFLRSSLESLRINRLIFRSAGVVWRSWNSTMIQINWYIFEFYKINLYKLHNLKTYLTFKCLLCINKSTFCICIWFFSIFEFCLQSSILLKRLLLLIAF